jgi:hypothetical protein
MKTTYYLLEIDGGERNWPVQKLYIPVSAIRNKKENEFRPMQWKFSMYVSDGCAVIIAREYPHNKLLEGIYLAHHSLLILCRLS